MSAFSLNYWKSKCGRYERVYITGDFIDGLKIYFMKDGRPGCPRAFGEESRREYPEPYCRMDQPCQAVADQALFDHGLDPYDFTWEELLEVAC